MGITLGRALSGWPACLLSGYKLVWEKNVEGNNFPAKKIVTLTGLDQD